MKRRDFVKAAGGATLAVSLTCCGLTWAAAQPPKIDLPEYSYGETETMNKKVLVTYATRAGSTAEVAAAIGETLAAQGAAVDVLPVKNVKDVAGYQAVIIGSGVRFSQWLPEAAKFVEQHQSALAGKQTAFFTVHLMNLDDDETSREQRLAYLDPVRKLVTPKSEAFFAGNGDPSKVSFLERVIGRAVKSPEGDLRDWQAIRAWAESLQTIL